jgi:DNA-binding transcriptional ArsR family regulator
MHEGIDEFSMPADEAVEHAAERLRILADPTRLRVLWALAQGESSVTCLAELSGAHPTAVSQHLAKLRMTGLVRARRQGTFQFYTVADESIVKLVEAAIGVPIQATSKRKPGRLTSAAASEGKPSRLTSTAGSARKPSRMTPA